jgi:predicted ATPase
MLTGITLENFKAFKEPQFIPIKPITLVFGQNNAGKSSIIHALAFLKHVHQTNGDCNPGQMIFGWSNLDLGSWKNLVFAQNENTSMMIKLHTETTTIQWRFEKARVASFEIEEKIGEDWIATAEGENAGTKGIMWQVKLHSSHSLWERYKAALWRKLSDSSIDPSQTSNGSAKATTQPETAANNNADHEDSVRSSDGDRAAIQQDVFDEHFNLWLGDILRNPPIDCDAGRNEQGATPFEGLFPRQPISGRTIAHTKMADYLISYYDNEESYELDGTLVDNSNISDKYFCELRKGIFESSLTPQESLEIFQKLYWSGSLSLIYDALHVDILLYSFESHLHLDAQRFPPEGTLSKNRLSSDRSEHQPWLKLLDNPSSHHFYGDFLSNLDYTLEQYPIPDKITAGILSAQKSYKLREKWPEIIKELLDTGVERAAISNLHHGFKKLMEKSANIVDLPPLMAATAGLRRIGIQYELGIRKHVTKVYAPMMDPRDDIREPDETTSDDELVFVRNSEVYTIHNVGSGVRVIVPVIVALTTAEVSLLSIEEPECHVHPKLQTELGDLLIQRIGWRFYTGPMEDLSYIEFLDGWDAILAGDKLSRRNNRQRSYTLIETHSEHLILRILRRIRETTEQDFSDWPEALKSACPDGIRPEDVAVLYVEPGEEGAAVKNLRVNHHGEFADEWPNGFFEERIKEVF